MLTSVASILKIQDSFTNDNREVFSFQRDVDCTQDSYLKAKVEEHLKVVEPQIQDRVRGEFFGYGPLAQLMDDVDVTEIMINGRDRIWFEKRGKLYAHSDQFASDLTYKNFLARLLSEAKRTVSVDEPVAQGQVRGFRLHYVGEEISPGATKICLRRHPEVPWRLDSLLSANWCTQDEAEFLKKIIHDKKNFLIVGGTGTGKTSALGALMFEVNPCERTVIIEDTPELPLTSPSGLKLLTRPAVMGGIRGVDQSDLLKNTLRLRPDRIVMGEIRGEEAKDFLMAISTGHDGSFGSLHAQSAQQALLRLEMLVQLGAPMWSLAAIRRLIYLSLHYIVVVGRKSSGQRYLEGVSRIASIEEPGLILEPCY